MKNSSHKIMTSHAGRLPVPPGCEDLPIKIYSDQPVDSARIVEGIASVVRKQIEIGIDCIGDGE